MPRERRARRRSESSTRRGLPHLFETRGKKKRSPRSRTRPTRSPKMLVRGAPLIGATAAYGLALALRGDASDARLEHAYAVLHATRPTAINLKWAHSTRRPGLLRPLPAGRARRGGPGLGLQRRPICEGGKKRFGRPGSHRRIGGAPGVPWTLIPPPFAGGPRKKGGGGPVNVPLFTHCNAPAGSPTRGLGHGDLSPILPGAPRTPRDRGPLSGSPTETPGPRAQPGRGGGRSPPGSLGANPTRRGGPHPRGGGQCPAAT